MPEKNGNMRLLIVDDMTNMRRTIKNMLKYTGYEYIMEAENGDTALKKMKSESIDFVICDWNMPVVSGIEFLRKVRDDERLKNIPFLMVTAEVDAYQIVQAAETEVDGYIIKPFVAKTLEEKINQIMEKKTNPSTMDSLMIKADKCAKNGKYDDAIFLYDEALRLSLKSVRIRHAIGQIYEKMGRDEEALVCYEEAAKNNPQFIHVHQSIGDFHIKKGNVDKAMQAIENAAKISPNNPERQTQLGKIYLQRGDMEKADRAFKTAVAVDPKNANIRTEIGEAYLKSGYDEKAAEAFKGSLNVVESVHVYNRLGIALRRKGKYLEAIDEYKKALKVDSNDEALYYNIGRAYLEANKRKEAISAFRKALEIDPNFEECRKIMEGLN
jgi:tetratricopeptide (TPR) repeat protein